MSDQHKPEGGIKEVLTSLMIAFAMALAFRGFVVEGFVIPTGSMAPTLLGMHMRFQAPENGANWPVGPWYYLDSGGQVPKPVQGRAPDRPVTVDIPHTGAPVPGGIRPLELTRSDIPRRSGDRIFVLKYLYQVFEPDRFDVVVFKNPTNPWENYIKRLVGLPGEQIALVDGDVFHRPASVRDPETLTSPWEGEGWQIGRKDPRVQRDLWYPVFDSRFSVLEARADFRPPWIGEGAWTFEDGIYTHAGPEPALLRWDAEQWPVTDFVHYNDNFSRPPQWARPDGFLQTRGRWTPVFPVSDIRSVISVEPEREDLAVEFRLRTRGHEFRARIADGACEVAMRAISDDEPWRVLDSGRAHLPTGRISTIEFWHVDQAVSLYIDGTLVCGGNTKGAYDWSPQERITYATGLSASEIMRDDTILFDARRYPNPELAWSFDGSPVRITRAGVYRDLFYQPTLSPPRQRGEPFRPARATHPTHPVNLAQGQYFVCGDNSAQSLDSRLMSTIDPWVDEQFETAEPGIIPRELLIGKAFFVYFPSLQWRGRIPVPDFGRMRFIR